MQQGGVYGVTKVSLVKQKISCCKCMFQNTVIVQIWVYIWFMYA